MSALKRLQKSSLAGTAMMGCLSFVLLISLCATLFAIRRPPAPLSTATGTASNLTPTQTLTPTITATGITHTATPWILPTNTLPPTQKVTSTPTPRPTDSSTSTPGNTMSVPQATAVLSCVPNNSPQVAKVLEVIDGDTLKVLLDGLIVKVKYIGIDAPESVSRLEYLGKEAKARNRELVSGRDVLLYRDVSEKDRFDRLLRYVFVEDRFINYELVSIGYASALDEPPDSACALPFEQAAAAAQEKSLGIWAPHTPQPAQSLAAASLVIFSVNKEAEFVDLQNVGEATIDLRGWRLISEKGVQECKLAGMVQPYEVYRIFSGVDQPGFSCGYEKPIWEDTEADPAILYDPEGAEVDRFP